MGVQSIQAVGGMFLVDGQAMDLGQLMLALNLDRTQAIDDQIADQMQEVQDKNTQLKALNALMAKCREFKADKCSEHDDEGAKGEKFTLPGYESEGAKNVEDWFKEFGLTCTDVNPGDDKDEWESEWDANIQTIKGAVDSLNSDSQIAMTSLQAKMNKRNQSDEMSSNILQKDQKSRDTVVGNFR